MSEFVLDASALLALLNQEPGSEAVASIITQAAISAVNLSEVVAKLAEAGMAEAVLRQVLEGLGFEVVPFDETQAFIAGLLRSQTRSLGLSFGDRACLALARERNLPVLTTDRVWENLNLGIEIRVVR
jgi:PIN domain nuclease of toxin-antitoxin system